MSDLQAINVFRPLNVDSSLLSEQQWTLTKNRRIINRRTTWIYQKRMWFVPNENDEGYVTDQETDKVLGVVDGDNVFGSKVTLQTKRNPENFDQKWERIPTDDFFFTLRNKNSGLFLHNGQGESDFPTVESMYFFIYKILSNYYWS